VNFPETIKDVVDLSVPLKSLDTAVFPGYPQPLRSTFTTVVQDGYASYVWTFAEHTSTHVDSPAHFIEGDLTIDKVPLKRYVGNGIVLDFSRKVARYSITRNDIEEGIKERKAAVGPGWIVLFYTGYTEKSKGADWMEHPELSDGASNYLTELGVNAIGFDAPSPDHAPFPAHKILLPETIGVYENLTNLDKILEKNFLFVGAPLALYGGSASPVRALAIIM
jgi:arylformamidase